MLKKTLPGLLDWVFRSGAFGPRLDPALMGRGLVGGWGETEKWSELVPRPGEQENGQPEEETVWE